MIDINKKYRTRDGREVRIYATDGFHDHAIHGAVKNGHNWSVCGWYSDGVYARSYRNGPRDLIEIRPRHKRTVWLNVYPSSMFGYATTREKADLCASPERIACIKVDLDFEEGEGL